MGKILKGGGEIDERTNKNFVISIYEFKTPGILKLQTLTTVNKLMGWVLTIIQFPVVHICHTSLQKKLRDVQQEREVAIFKQVFIKYYIKQV